MSSVNRNSLSAKGMEGVALMARLAKSIWPIISVALQHGR